MRKIKNGLILAGGDSTRFWPLGEKNFISFLGKPLILYQIESLSKYCEKITIIVSKANAVAINRLIENLVRQLKCQVVTQKDVDGQAGAIISAKNLVRGETLIVNANDIYNYSVLDNITKFSPPKNKIIFLGKKLNEYFPGGYFKFDDDDKLKEIIEKPGKDRVPSMIYNLVVHYYSEFDNLIRAIESVKTQEDNHYELAINKLLSSSIDRDYFLYDGYWVTLKYPWHLLTMLKWFLNSIKTSKIFSSAHISKKAFISGPVIIGNNVRVGDFVKITGPVFIGNNSVIGDYSLVRESQIGEDCLIGSYTEVARSYIGNKVFLHRNYIGDSILDDKVMIGAQAVTANLRFDGETVSNTNLSKLGAIIGQESKIGVNATLAPGIKIGKKTWIGLGEVVTHDLKDKVYLDNGNEKINLKV